MHPRSQDREKGVLDNTCEIILHIVESHKVLVFLFRIIIFPMHLGTCCRIFMGDRPTEF